MQRQCYNFGVQTSLDLTSIVLIIGTIIISLVIHEFMHAFVGLKLGDDTAQEQGRISFNPLDHIDPFMTIVLPIVTLLLFGIPVLAAKPVPFSMRNVKWDEFGVAIVAAAGPLSNLGLAFIGAALYRLVGTPGFLTDALALFTAINVGIFIFNMIPIPPLDGSRVLYAFAPESVQNFMTQMEQFGLFLVFALVIGVAQFGEIIGNIQTSILNFLL